METEVARQGKIPPIILTKLLVYLSDDTIIKL